MLNNRERKPKRWEMYKREFQIPELRIDEPVGLYPRQSTERQKKKNRQSYEKQTIDGVENLRKRGWSEDLIWLYDQDNGHSAAQNLEDREAMDQMLADIREGRIRTVSVTEVDRLFRDEDRIDSNVFIKVCKEANCLVLTDRMIYNFSIPRHVERFRDEVDQSWRFYEYQILIKAGEHQDRARSKGLYTGGPPAIGYVVDKNEKSPTYLRYIPYMRHSERTIELFQWLYDCGGTVGLVFDKLEKLPYVWPLEEEWVRDQKAFWTNLEVVHGVELDEEGKPKPIGYRITIGGLRKLYKNRAYLGDWSYDGNWIEGNHEAIVPKDLWDFAQECVERKQPLQASETRNYYTSTNSIIHSILYPGPEGIKQRYITRRRNKDQYCIMDWERAKRTILGTIAVKDVEQEFIKRFTVQLRDTQRFEDYEKKIVRDEDARKIESRRKNLQDTLNELSDRIDGLFLTLQSSKLKQEERDEFLEERHKLIKRREAVQNEMKIQSPVQLYLKYKDLIEKMGKYWDRYPLDDRQTLVALLVKRVYLEPLSHHFMKITIDWKEFDSDIGIVWRRHADSIYWTAEEDQLLRDMYPLKSPQEMLQALPRRTWKGIFSRASDLHIRRVTRTKGTTTMEQNMTFEDAQVIKDYDIPVENLGSTLFTTWA